jgi:parvulin-like peptidyl-prolyl isomerase
MIAAVLMGCDAPDTHGPEEAVLIHTEQRVITKGQFERAFETARLAYSDNRHVDPRLIQQARLRMLNQMTEELIIDHRAEELGLALDDQELETAIQEIKKDYQENEFEQMLLESAIPYSLWKDRLRVRLLMEKVIDRDLAESVTISAQDIEDYYKSNESEFAVDREKPPEADLKHRIVAQLRRQKVEAAYPGWMDGLRKRYQVTINWELWGSPPDPDTNTADEAMD